MVDATQTDDTTKSGDWLETLKQLSSQLGSWFKDIFDSLMSMFSGQQEDAKSETQAAIDARNRELAEGLDRTQEVSEQAARQSGMSAAELRIAEEDKALAQSDQTIRERTGQIRAADERLAETTEIKRYLTLRAEALRDGKIDEARFDELTGAFLDEARIRENLKQHGLDSETLVREARAGVLRDQPASAGPAVEVSRNNADGGVPRAQQFSFEVAVNSAVAAKDLTEADKALIGEQLARYTENDAGGISVTRDKGQLVIDLDGGALQGGRFVVINPNSLTATTAQLDIMGDAGMPSTYQITRASGLVVAADGTASFAETRTAQAQTATNSALRPMSDNVTDELAQLVSQRSELSADADVKPLQVADAQTDPAHAFKLEIFGKGIERDIKAAGLSVVAGIDVPQAEAPAPTPPKPQGDALVPQV